MVQLEIKLKMIKWFISISFLRNMKILQFFEIVFSEYYIIINKSIFLRSKQYVNQYTGEFLKRGEKLNKVYFLNNEECLTSDYYLLC